MGAERPRRWRPEDGLGPPPVETKRSSVLVGLAAFGVFALVVGGIVAAVVVPSVLKARAGAAEVEAVTTLRALASAEETYHALNDGYATIPDLVAANLVDRAWGETRERGAYRYSVEVAPGRDGFTLRADPLPDSGYDRHFYLGDDLAVRVAEGRPAGPDSPELEAGDAAPRP
jgi:Tfp pilus assembly protein PilE